MVVDISSCVHALPARLEHRLVKAVNLTRRVSRHILLTEDFSNIHSPSMP